MNIQPTTYSDLAHLMIKNNPKLYQSQDLDFIKHNATHTFLGALVNNEGEVIVTAFYRWLKNRKMTLQDAIEVFRGAEEHEINMFMENSKTPLQRLRDDEIKRYVEIFEMLVEETIKQTGKEPIHDLIETLPILKTPDGWLA